MRAIAIDDDPVALLLIKKHATNNPKIELVATYNDPVRGAAAVILDKPDILFLDMEMPDFEGLKIMDGILNHPKIVVISSNPDYTEKAMALNAVSFIDKPLDQDRFNDAIDKVEGMLRLRREQPE